MYASHQLLRVHQDEWLRHAETRRLSKQAAASSGASGRSTAAPAHPAARPAFRPPAASRANRGSEPRRGDSHDS
jgi:hypothetical protein